MKRVSKLEVHKDSILQAYLDGESGTSIANRLGVKHNTIYDFLRRNGIEIRSRGGREKVYDDGFTQEFARLYKSGMTIIEIAEALNVGHGTVQRHLSSVNITRPNGTRKVTISLPEDPAQLGYIAGLLDGEGNLQMKPGKRRNGTPGQSIGCKLAIYSTNEEVIRWLEQQVGGNVRMQDRSDKGWKKVWIWTLYRSRDVQLLLQTLLPHLIIKRSVAETMLAYFEIALGDNQ